MRKLLLIFIYLFGAIGYNYAQNNDSEKFASIFDLSTALRDQGPHRIADFDFDGITQNADKDILLSLTQAMCSVQLDQITPDDIKKYYLPYFFRLIKTLADSDVTLNEIRMGRSFRLETFLSSALESDDINVLRTWLNNFWGIANTVSYYISTENELKISGMSPDFNYNNLYFLEAALYGETAQMEDKVYPCIPSDVITKLASLFGLSEDTAAILPIISQKIMESMSNNNINLFVDNAYEIALFSSWTLPNYLFSGLHSYISLALRVTGHEDEINDIMYRVGQSRYGDAYNTVYYHTLLLNNNNSYDLIANFIQLREKLQQDGCEFANYLPVECPLEFRLDERFDNYYEQYARVQWQVIRELSSGLYDQTTLVASSAMSQMLDFFGCPDLPTFYAQALKVAVEMYYKGHTWAMDVIDQTLPLVYSCGGHDPLTMCIVARYYYDFGDWPKIEYILNQYILPYASTCNFSDEQLTYDLLVVAHMLSLSAILANEQGNEQYVKLADTLKDKALDKLTRVDNDAEFVEICGYFSDYFVESKDYNSCISLTNEALSRCSDESERLWLTFGLFEAEYDSKNYTAAAKHGIKILEEIPNQIIDQDGFIADLIKCFVFTGDMAHLKTHSAKYIEALHEQISQKVFNLLGDEREALCNRLRKNIAPVLECCQEGTLPEQAKPILSQVLYEWALLSKGLLLEADNILDQKLSTHQDPVVRNRYQQMKNYSALLENDKLRNTSPELTDLHQSLFFLAQQDVISIMRKNNIEYKDSGHLNIHWQDVRDHLQRNEVAVEFGRVDPGNEQSQSSPQYYALVLRKGYDAPSFIPLCSESDILKISSRLGNERLYNNRVASKQLYGLLWKPLEPYMKTGDTVYFSTDGQLHLLNLEVLLDENDTSADDRYKLRRLSSTRELCLDRTYSLSEAKLYGGLNYKMNSSEVLQAMKAFARTSRAFQHRGTSAPGEVPRDSLPGTLPEVEDISKMLTQHGVKVEIVKGNDGIEESIKALSGSTIDLLHFATHGFYMNGLVNYQSGDQILSPMMRAGIMCSGSEQPVENAEDGILLAREIADLDLSSVDMCFLSACESAQGDVTYDGVFGLQRGFKQAGVGTLIMSLWKVNDELAQLMTTAFYRYLVVDKLERHEAFKRARADAKTVYPQRDWAAFIMLD